MAWTTPRVHLGVKTSVPLSNATVRERAAGYVRAAPGPTASSRGARTPAQALLGGRTAVVSLSGEAELPMIGAVLSDLGVSIRITVKSSARADLEP